MGTCHITCRIWGSAGQWGQPGSPAWRMEELIPVSPFPSQPAILCSKWLCYFNFHFPCSYLGTAQRFETDCGMEKNTDEAICLYKPIQWWNFYCTVSWRHYLMRWSHSQSERESARAGGVNINRFTRFHAEIRIPKGKSFGMLPYSTEEGESGGEKAKEKLLFEEEGWSILQHCFDYSTHFRHLSHFILRLFQWSF